MDISIIAESSISSAGVENSNQMGRMNIPYLYHLGAVVGASRLVGATCKTDYYHPLVHPVLFNTHAHLSSFLFISKYYSVQLPDANKVESRII